MHNLYSLFGYAAWILTSAQYHSICFCFEVNVALKTWIMQEMSLCCLPYFWMFIHLWNKCCILKRHPDLWTQVRTGEGVGNLLETYCDKVREGFELTFIDQTRTSVYWSRNTETEAVWIWVAFTLRSLAQLNYDSLWKESKYDCMSWNDYRMTRP